VCVCICMLILYIHGWKWFVWFFFLNFVLLYLIVWFERWFDDFSSLCILKGQEARISLEKILVLCANRLVCVLVQCFRLWFSKFSVFLWFCIDNWKMSALIRFLLVNWKMAALLFFFLCRWGFFFFFLLLVGNGKRCPFLFLCSWVFAF
jgi:hypothetical protein